jgi:proline iminopeptidase
MRKVFGLLIMNLFTLTLNSQIIGNKFIEGETYLKINGIKHWIKLEGLENKTVPIIVLHGGPGGDNYNFERTVGSLLEKYATIVYYEQRGCGRSDAAKDTNDYTIPTLIDDLDILIEMLGSDKVNLLGYSFGAELALRYTKRYPGKVNKLILESPAELSIATKFIQIHGFYSLANNELRKTIQGIIEQNSTIDEKYFKVWNSVSTNAVDSFLFVDQTVAKMNRQLWRESNLPSQGRKHFQRVIIENSKGDLLKTVNGLESECLIIAGIHDKNGGFHYGKDLNLILPNSNLKLYRYSAHFPDMEEPEKFALDIKNFILD